jgi:AraC-like DNA-binding protein
MEFYPLGMLPDQSGVLLHETGYLPSNDDWFFPNTLSPFWRLYYNFKPGHKVIFPHSEFELTPAHIVLIPDHQLFHSHGRIPVPHFWMSFQAPRRLDPRQSIPILLPPESMEITLLQKLAGLFTGIGTGERERILHGSLALLHLALMRPEIHWQEGLPPEGLRRAIQRMEAEHAKPLNMTELARTSGLCLRGFTQAFKRHRGVTPGRFLIQVRVREAANLLANSEAGIDEIAEKSGFPNRHYFSRMFKKLTGDSPAQFRHKSNADAAHRNASTADASQIRLT